MKVKVYTDNPHVKVWKETFKGETIEIKYGEPIEMEFYEAHEFRGQFYPQIIRADRTQDPVSFKMIRVEKPAEGEVDDGVEVFQCNACKKVFTTDTLLTKHGESVHGDKMVIDPALDREIAAKKRGPGRPTKDTTKSDQA